MFDGTFKGFFINYFIHKKWGDVLQNLTFYDRGGGVHDLCKLDIQ